ncbi:type II/IV secretion system protein [Pseudoduganella eburnea]|uniref:Type II/IV secretion system protein n=1 Tax=Massilia eburnea TaxID=1776165 RepID=A0A6L6QGC0_9BURK|nr:GspE/PulE family protein [Massilia eburnea]MTW10726.1 type II/IV secretion system protein [Massilia eburnea]
MTLPVLEASVLAKARAQCVHSKRSLVEELEALSGIEPRLAVRALAQPFGLAVLETADMLAFEPAFDLMPLSQAMARHCVLLRSYDGAAVGVIADPFDLDLQTWLATQARCSASSPLQLRLALQSDIQAYLSKQEESARAVDTLVSGAEGQRRDGKTAAVLSFASVSEGASPAVRLVNSTLYDALKAGASDIHLESTAGGLAVKYRVDGVLDHATAVNGIDVAEQIISRLKVLAELDIAERRVPQDGSFRVESMGREIDLRVSIMPSIHGEDAVIRILDKRAMIESYGSLTLEALGFDAPSLATLRSLAQEAYGMLLVTGPTGSGKTTTLYAALTEIHNGREKIITIEDPVEYQLPGILQIPVNEKKGLTFAKGLRSILRHDPDKIMVGEIRDRETAEIAVQSALTGHLVLTTVHANNVFDVFGRFTHMGIDPYAFVSALNGIWAQRLVRINCPHCAVEVTPSDEELASVGLARGDVYEYSFKEGKGCGDCRGTGFKGRRSIAEILTLNDEIRELIVEKRPIRQIKAAAYANGTRSLRHAALELVRRGDTTLAEIKRVTLHA